MPEKKNKVLNRVRNIRDGDLNDTSFHDRMRGEGEFAEQIEHLFSLGCKQAGLNQERTELTTEHFTPPSGPQKTLFPELE